MAIFKNADLFKLATSVTTVNLIIRGITLAGKFFLVFFLAKHLTTEQLGYWGIFSTSISLSIYLVGLDFYTYSSRNILEYPVEDTGVLLRDQMILYSISYAIFFPILSLLFVFEVIEVKFILFFYGVLIFEHFAQESYRIFVVFSKPFIANIILFLRTGMWPYLLVTLWISGFEEFKNLKWVYLFWIGGGMSAMIISLIFILRVPFKKIRKIPVNWHWIKTGIRVSLLFFIGTIAFKIVEFADRYFIDFYHTKEDVGVYTFYANMSNIIEIVVHTAVIIIFSPKLIEAFYSSQKNYRLIHAKFSRQTILFSLLAFILIFAMIYPIIYFLDKPEFFEQFNVFTLLCFAEVIFNVSLIFHYILYVRRNDTAIVKAAVFAAFVNIMFNFLLIPQYSTAGAALATFISFVTLTGAKAYYSRKFPEAKQIIYFKFARKIFK